MDSACYDPNCRGRVCLTAEQEQYHRENGTSFFCSAGHSQVFKPSENKKLRARIEALEAELASMTRDRDHWKSQWRCPHKDCHFTTHQKARLAYHLSHECKHTGKALKLLPAHAGSSR